MIIESIIAMIGALAVFGFGLLWHVIHRNWPPDGDGMSTFRILTSGLLIVLIILLAWDILQAAGFISKEWELFRRLMKWVGMGGTVWLTLSTIFFPRVRKKLEDQM